LEPEALEKPRANSFDKGSFSSPNTDPDRVQNGSALLIREGEYL